MEVSEHRQDRECKQHGAYAARLIVFAGKELGGGCPTCMTERDAKEEAHRQRMQADAERRSIESLFQRSGIPPRFQQRTLANYVAQSDGQKAALRKAQAYVDGWTEVLDRGTCLIFAGNAGTGKTHLACAIANALIARSVSALFTTVSDAMRAIKRSYDPSSQVSEGQAINTFVYPKLLILDEVGGSKGTEHELQLMFDIINKRYENSRPTIILTNLDAVALREHLGERVTDRLREGGGKLIPFTWESHRC